MCNVGESHQQRRPDKKAFCAYSTVCSCEVQTQAKLTSDVRVQGVVSLSGGLEVPGRGGGASEGLVML